jgi:hypothetical protein
MVGDQPQDIREGEESMIRWAAPVGSLMAITSLSASAWVNGGPVDGLIVFGGLMAVAVMLLVVFSDE